MIRRSAASLGLLAVLLVSSCSAVSPYPAGWGRLRSDSSGCELVAGSFANLGVWGEGSGRNYRPLLSDFLRFGHMADPQAEATRFDFSFPAPGEFLVVGTRGETVVYRKTMRAGKGEYACENSGIVIRGSRIMGENVAGYESWKHTLLKNETGDLVIRSQEGGFGLVMLLIPAGGSETCWIRFPALPASSP